MHQISRIQASSLGFRLGRALPLLAATFALAACATTSQTPPQPDTDEEPGAWYESSLHWSRTAAEHRAIFEQTFRLAAARLEQLAEGREPGTWGVSSDADETLIDNSQYDLESSRAGGGFSWETWDAWVNRKAAPALPGAAEFARKVKDMGGVFAVVTNRSHGTCAATAENLRNVGIVYDVVLCKEPDSSQKEPRWDALAQGTTASWLEAQFSGDRGLPPIEVLMWLGDNVGDFPDLEQDMRRREGALSEFGDRYFALPNPMYGSWEENPKE